jgi:DNA-binding GntR family transcriptional regulator
MMAERDFDLHRALMELSGHGRLIEQYRQIEHQVRMYISSSDALIANPKHIVQQHLQLVEAVLAGRDDVAARLAEQHNLTEGEVLVAHLKDLEHQRR